MVSGNGSTPRRGERGQARAGWRGAWGAASPDERGEVEEEQSRGLLDKDPTDTHYIENAICTFGRLTGWRNDPANLAGLLIRARVTDLEDVPEFIVMSEGEFFQGFSWTVQVEILQQNLLGALPADEEPVPPFNDGNPVYDFFGYGQVGHAPFEPEDAPEQEQAEQEAAPQWGLWDAAAPDAAPAAPNANLDLNAVPVPEQEIPEPVEEHMQENEMNMEIAQQEGPNNHPHMLAEDDFIELNDLIGDLEGPQNSDVLSGNLSINSDASNNQNVPILNPDLNQVVDQPNNILENAEPGGENVILALAAAMDAPLAFLPEDIHMDELAAEHEEAGDGQVMNFDLNVIPQQQDVFQAQAPAPAPVQEAAQQPILFQNQASQGIQLNELVIQHNQQQEPQVEAEQVPPEDHEFHNNIQVGFMQLTPNEVDPVFQSRQMQHALEVTPHPDMYRLWARYFEPIGQPERIVSIPRNWASFFVNKLLSPDGFEWAKGFLLSQGWQFLCENGMDTLSFSLPPKRIEHAGIQCVSMHDIAEVEQDSDNDSDNDLLTTPTEKIPAFHTSISTSALHEKKKRARSPPIVNTEVRRSSRIKDRLKGFKNAQCEGKGCFACSSAPPTLSPSMIKNLGHTFCKIPLDEISEPKLTTKRKTKTVTKGDLNAGTAATKPRAQMSKKVISKKVVKKPSNNEANEDKQNKKPKK
ncbi:hypothetical protein EJB05_43819, partial [Eragrostis curvula]